MDRSALDDAVRVGDLDDLLRLVDRCCDQRDWESLAVLHDACARAHESGRQLWPAASHAAYRLALDAPAPFAASVLVDGEGHFAAGPLAEVAAQSHSWHDLAPHVAPSAIAVLTAHERVVRGEDLRAAPPSGPAVLELPWRLASWEPAYAVAEYEPDRAAFPAPDAPTSSPLELPSAPPTEPTDDVAAALRETTGAWATESDGRTDVVVVRGAAASAIAALGPRAARAVQVSGAEALAHVAWAGASGGAHGRRRGAAAGRFAAWWLAGALADALDDWPPADDTRIRDAIARCRWFLWDAGEPATGWRLQLAIEDPDSGRAWAIAATDAA
jgi:hypothetical protein